MTRAYIIRHNASGYSTVTVNASRAHQYNNITPIDLLLDVNDCADTENDCIVRDGRNHYFLPLTDSAGSKVYAQSAGYESIKFDIFFVFEY